MCLSKPGVTEAFLCASAELPPVGSSMASQHSKACKLRRAMRICRTIYGPPVAESASETVAVDCPYSPVAVIVSIETWDWSSFEFHLHQSRCGGSSLLCRFPCGPLPVIVEGGYRDPFSLTVFLPRQSHFFVPLHQRSASSAVLFLHPAINQLPRYRSIGVRLTDERFV